MPFKPGISGNPSGRPKATLADGRTLAEVAREHTEAAINALAEIAANKEETASARVSAATALLDRGWGRPKQAIVGGDEGDAPLRFAQDKDVVNRPISSFSIDEEVEVMDRYLGIPPERTIARQISEGRRAANADANVAA